MTALEFLDLDDEWRAEAVCAQIGGDIWHPEKGGSTREAKLVCNGGPGREPCPVREQCLQYALDHDERFGIWGGYSERERRALRRGERPPVVRSNGHGTTARYGRGCRCERCRAAYSAYQREYRAARRGRVTCDRCGAEVTGRGRKRFCSKECARHRTGGFPTCRSCGKQFVARADAKYCSQQCRQQTMRPGRGEVECARCGRAFVGKAANKFCSEGCRREARRAYFRDYMRQRRQAS